MGSEPGGRAPAGGQAQDQLTPACPFPEQPALHPVGAHTSGWAPFVLMAAQAHKGPVCRKSGLARFSASHPTYPVWELHPRLEVGSQAIIRRM